VNAEQALQLLDNQAKWCRSKEDHEMLCLLLPALLRVLNLKPIDDFQAKQLRDELRRSLKR
jgi:hypothetical protein